MQIHNLAEKTLLKNLRNNNQTFIICEPNEILDLKEKYNLDDESIFHCLDSQDKVLYIENENYDFISIVNLKYENREVHIGELNMIVSETFLILVLCSSLTEFNQKIDEFLESKKNPTLNMIYHCCVNQVLENINEGLSHLEDDLKNLESEMINRRIDKHQFLLINKFKEMTYKTTKYIREISYVSDQLLADEHHYIHKEFIKYFLNVKMRIDKAYELSQYLGKLSDNLLNIYDSRITAKTNETVTKLTIVTIFFGPMTIITGIYGMNFKNMPEIYFEYGYPLALLTMVLISGIIFFLLKKKKIV